MADLMKETKASLVAKLTDALTRVNLLEKNVSNLTSSYDNLKKDYDILFKSNIDSTSAANDYSLNYKQSQELVDAKEHIVRDLQGTIRKYQIVCAALGALAVILTIALF